MKNTYLIFALFGSLLFTACNPNKDIYNQLDEAKQPYHETVSYSIADAEYAWSGNKTVTTNKAFCDTLLPETFIPTILSRKFPALNLGSIAAVSYNYISRNTAYDPTVMFGYELTDADYQSLGNPTVAVYKSFDGTNKSTDLIPPFLLSKYPSAAANDTQNVVIKYNYAWNLERYVFSGSAWSRLTTDGLLTDFGKIGYTLVDADYYSMGGSVAQYKDFSSTDSPDMYLPVFLKSKYPYANTGAVKFVKYKYHGTVTENRIDKYTYNGSVWVKAQRTDLYIFSSTGWIYDPAVRFTMNNEDYAYILSQDTKLKDAQNGFEYGSSTKYYNISFNTYDWKTYNPDAFTGLSSDQITAKIVEQVKLGLIKLLEHNYPNAQPLVKGVESYYYVTFNAYKGTAPVLTYKFQCMAAANGSTPPVFEFVEIAQ